MRPRRPPPDRVKPVPPLPRRLDEQQPRLASQDTGCGIAELIKMLRRSALADMAGRRQVLARRMTLVKNCATCSRNSRIHASLAATAICRCAIDRWVLGPKMAAVTLPNAAITAANASSASLLLVSQFIGTLPGPPTA